MNHFKKVWEYLIALNKSSFVDLLVSPDYLSHAFYDMLRYIHESAIITVLVKTIFSDFYSSEAQVRIYEHLNDLDFLESVNFFLSFFLSFILSLYIYFIQ